MEKFFHDALFGCAFGCGFFIAENVLRFIASLIVGSRKPPQ